MRLKQVIPRDPVTGEWEPRNEEEREALMAKLYPEEREWAAQMGGKPKHSLRLPVIIAGSLFTLLAGLVWGCDDSYGQDGLQSSRPQGYFGQGHEQFHEFYYGLRNGVGGSCCSGADGRPTQARWNDVTNTWDVMVDGQWRTLRPDEGYKVLTDTLLQAQGRSRWDNQAHVFTNPNGSTIYCLVPPASGG